MSRTQSSQAAGGPLFLPEDVDGARYPPISDYALIGDCHTAALVSRQGSVDWYCIPRFDSGSAFGRLLDWDRGGSFAVHPAEPFRSSRRYLPGTMVLETTFETDNGVCRLLDSFAMREGGREAPYRQLMRLAEGVEGCVVLDVRLTPRFDFGSLKPLLRPVVERVYSAIGGDDGLVIDGDVPFAPSQHHDLRARLEVAEGSRHWMTVRFMTPAKIDWEPPGAEAPEVLDRRLEETIAWWRGWSADIDYDGPFADEVMRSALVLKALTYAPSGAIVAAPTTSLPERADGGGTWDYRYSWIRDSVFALRSLAKLGGGAREAEAFRRFVERSAAAVVDQLQVLYGLEGEHLRRLQEFKLDWLEGWRGAQPVRVGNAAAWQLQHGTIGYVMELASASARRGQIPDKPYRTFLHAMVDVEAEQWHVPDQGIWELRGEPQHYVHSKAMAWAAVDYGIRLADTLNFEGAPADRWREVRDEIRRSVEAQGYDPNRGVFVQAYGQPRMDAALLLLPTTGFVDYKDDRMLRTVAAIREELGCGKLVRRFAVPEGEAEEGAFLPACFWLAECLARQGAHEEAVEVFEASLAAANDVRLLSEVYDPETGEMRGNFPQALTHLALIGAAVALDQALR